MPGKHVTSRKYALQDPQRHACRSSPVGADPSRAAATGSTSLTEVMVRRVGVRRRPEPSCCVELAARSVSLHGS